MFQRLKPMTTSFEHPFPSMTSLITVRYGYVPLDTLPSLKDGKNSVRKGAAVQCGGAAFAEVVLATT